MKKLLIVGLLFGAAGIVRCQEESARNPSRPRIRRYDQPVEIIQPGGGLMKNRNGSSDRLRDSIRKERDVQGEKTYGNSFISEIPIQRLPQSMPEQGEEEESESWINPLEFLSEEEQKDLEDAQSLFEMEDPEGEVEFEISDWESLEEDLAAQESEQPEEAEFENDDQFLPGQRVDEPDGSELSTGLTLGTAGREDTLTGVQQDGDSAPGAADTRSNVVQSVLAMPVPLQVVNLNSGGSVAEPPPALNHSRKLFDEVRNRWEPPAPSTGSSSAADRPDRRPEVGSRPSQFNPPPSAASLDASAAIGRISGMEPAPVSFPPSRTSPMENLSERPSGSRPESRVRQNPDRMNRFDRGRGRIRSRLGTAP